MGNERRRDYMVEKRIHLLYIITFITSLALVVAAGLTGYALYNMKPQPHVEPILGLPPFALVGALVFVVVASALTLGVWGIVHTHRMLGSAYHIGMHLEKLNSGQPVGALTLRDGDYFKEIADEVNKLQTRLPAVPPSGPPKA